MSQKCVQWPGETLLVEETVCTGMEGGEVACPDVLNTVARLM